MICLEHHEGLHHTCMANVGVPSTLITPQEISVINIQPPPLDKVL